jgi:hypothetical protein
MNNADLIRRVFKSTSVESKVLGMLYKQKDRFSSRDGLPFKYKENVCNDLSKDFNQKAIGRAIEELDHYGLIITAQWGTGKDCLMISKTGVSAHNKEYFDNSPNQVANRLYNLTGVVFGIIAMVMSAIGLGLKFVPISNEKPTELNQVNESLDDEIENNYEILRILSKNVSKEDSIIIDNLLRNKIKKPKDN